MELNQISERIIGFSIEIHKTLGPGMLESAYEKCLEYELKKAGFTADRQLSIPIHYKELVIEDAYRLDLLVENKVVVELKTVDVLLPVHDAQLITYLRFSNKELGLLINFRSKLLKEGIKRFKN